jgi:transcriptional regulator with PAS, ATPase and Fis domain
MPGVDAIVPLETAELRYLQWALAHHAGDRKSLAEQLGISERTLYRKLAV